MGEGGKIKEDLINELRQMRQWLSELEESEIQHKQAEEELTVAFRVGSDSMSITTLKDGRFIEEGSGEKVRPNSGGYRPRIWRKYCRCFLLLY